MGNGAFSEILALLKKHSRRIWRLVEIFFNKNFSVHFRRGKYIAEDRAFLQVFYPILKCRLSRSVGRRAVARLFFSAVFACRRNLAQIDFIALTNY